MKNAYLFPLILPSESDQITTSMPELSNSDRTSTEENILTGTVTKASNVITISGDTKDSNPTTVFKGNENVKSYLL